MVLKIIGNNKYISRDDAETQNCICVRWTQDRVLETFSVNFIVALTKYLTQNILVHGFRGFTML